MSLSPELQAVGDRVVASVKEHVARATRPLIERLERHARRAESTDQLLADLERRIAELEARSK
jgi:hypothetical protein